MSLDAQIVEFWKDALIPIPSMVLKGFSLSRETLEFLQEVGIPGKLGPLSSLIADAVSITFYNDPNMISEVSFFGKKYVVIGEDSYGYETWVCIEELSDSIVWIDENAPVPVAFVNSTIKHFLLFLKIYLVEGALLFEETDAKSLEIGRKIVNRIRLKFNQSDAKALQDKDNFWYSIIDELEQAYI